MMAITVMEETFGSALILLKYLWKSSINLICSTSTYRDWMWKLPSWNFSKTAWSPGIQASACGYLVLSVFASPKNTNQTLPLTHRTHKHSFSLTELTAIMNLNYEMHKRRVCFNSCFYMEALELLFWRRLILKASSFHCPIFSMLSCQGTTTEVFSTKGAKQKKDKRMVLDAKTSYTGIHYMLTQGFSPNLFV